MRFTLLRNAVGNAATGTSSGALGALSGSVVGAAMHDPAITELLNRLRNRFFGKYRGTVASVDAADSARSRRWCRPCSAACRPAGACRASLMPGPMSALPSCRKSAPASGSSSRRGDVSYPIWSGCYWREGELPPGATPAVKAIVTAGGSSLLLDDGASTITMSDGNQNTVTLDSSGITLRRGSGSVAVTDCEVNINNGGLEVT